MFETPAEESEVDRLAIYVVSVDYEEDSWNMAMSPFVLDIPQKRLRGFGGGQYPRDQIYSYAQSISAIPAGNMVLYNFTGDHEAILLQPWIYYDPAEDKTMAIAQEIRDKTVNLSPIKSFTPETQHIFSVFTDTISESDSIFKGHGSDSETQRSCFDLQWNCPKELISPPDVDIDSLQLVSQDVDKLNAFDVFLKHPKCLLHRPAGFGKTAFLEQLVSYCDISSNQVSDEVTSSKLGTHYRSHLILSFDLSKVDVTPTGTFAARLEKYIVDQVRSWAHKYFEHLDSDFFFDHRSASQLCITLPKYSPEHSTIVVIDSYDVPYLNASL
ncbi:hypothetical protein GYMLUDRAFT_237614 [Collybiopsis luxurians FD-317 M1]|nr:hypothetical protein GYMLUDRAFT_237614 [Collybiopsis luxurians FD-317 M1]